MRLTHAQLRIIRILADWLNQHNVPYQFTGGLAGNIHGSKWPLHDIDVDVYQADIPLLLEQLASWIIRPFGRFVDEEFDLFLVTLRIDGVEIDVSQVEDAFILSEGDRVPLITDLNKSEDRLLFGTHVRVIPLEDLISYKGLLGRKADVADLSSLR